MKRVVITGAGTINALGHSVPETLEAMREGRCGIAQLNMRDAGRLIELADQRLYRAKQSGRNRIIAQ